MARGHFRTDNKICVCCGASGKGVKIYKRGLKNIPSYDCEKCFDKYASKEEKLEKARRLVTENGFSVEIKKDAIVQFRENWNEKPTQNNIAIVKRVAKDKSWADVETPFGKKRVMEPYLNLKVVTVPLIK